MFALNFPSFKKISIIFFLLIFSVSVEGQIILKKIDYANMVVDFPEEMLVEKGYIMNSIFSINNNGESNLYNVKISIEGNNSNWFELQTNKTDRIEINKTKEIMTKISIPKNILIGNYNFSLNIVSDELVYRKNFVISVFESRDDILAYQVQGFRSDLNEMEEEAKKIETKNVNLSYAEDIFYQIRSEINLADDQIRNKMYSQLTETIRDIEKLFIKARFEISHPPNVTESKDTRSIDIFSKDNTILFLGVGIVLLFVSLIYLVRKTKIENKIRIPNLRIKELIRESKKLKEIEDEINKMKESQGIIEEEYKESMISKESYEELRLKYQERLMELEGERRKERGY